MTLEAVKNTYESLSVSPVYYAELNFVLGTKFNETRGVLDTMFDGLLDVNSYSKKATGT